MLTSQDMTSDGYFAYGHDLRCEHVVLDGVPDQKYSQYEPTVQGGVLAKHGRVE